jgi:hypothetical protein
MSKCSSIDDLTFSHHAYCLIGNASIHERLLHVLNKKFSVNLHGNADLFLEEYATFTIDNARNLKSLHETRPNVNDGLKIFVLTIHNITVEAQNSLLKLLEEPAPYARFFLIVPSESILLPTLRSRLYIIHAKAGESENEVGAKSAADFILMPINKRLEFVKKMVDDISDEKIPRQVAIEFINSLQILLYEKIGAMNGFKELSAIETVTKFMDDRSPSLKMLLDYLALNVSC